MKIFKVILAFSLLLFAQGCASVVSTFPGWHDKAAIRVGNESIVLPQPLSPSLSPLGGERVAEGRERGRDVQSPPLPQDAEIQSPKCKVQRILGAPEIPKGAIRQLALSAAIIAPRTITMTWNNPDPATVSSWEIWHSPGIPFDFSQWAVVGEQRYTKPCDLPQEYLTVLPVVVLPDGTVLKWPAYWVNGQKTP
jgi:hypothetical protein